MSDRPYQMLPPLDPDHLDLLRQSIAANGVLEPVVFDEDGEILDGHHRVEIAEELDIDYPRRVVTDLDEAGKRRYAITTNVARRQLIPAVRGALVAQLRTQGMSIRQIAEEAGLPKTTVARDLKQLSHLGQLEQPERITGADGRERSTTQPIRALAETIAPVVKAAEVFDAAVTEFPELEHYRDRPTKATALADQLRTFEPTEQATRRETLGKVIQAERDGRLTPKPDPAAEALALADRLFVAVNEAAQVAEKVGGVDAIDAAIAHADPAQIELWRDQFTNLAATLADLASACRPQLRRVQ